MTTPNSPNKIQSQDEYWMEYALSLADNAWKIGEVPVGAVLVKDNELVSQGWNQSISLNDPSAHAEMIAIREGGKLLNNYRMLDCTLYVTLEPCPMCAGLLVHSRIKRLVFGAKDYKTGFAGSLMNLLNDERLNHQIEVQGDVLGEQCASKISDFFKMRREQKKALKQIAKTGTQLK
ncbi:tRNA adenosine(34) deaminase TadA [Aliiglaciecola sp. 3_MG-2023]|uniref:tRNA adenosine(34) deaminase TadA n=1 Tax=Aliiglaciecola sp. 3_MG-2023 TaxID=3062644 RepID=UPI0026E1BE54|nr:tRNA adenosine(34) deaminase TadA [Aliiglaciecola sp. 3_MG-2023]MDO6691787.1 tRNA adenosine(34) deaminase TadA [Aliiglaciecola sp. 3_MG-2023]